MRVCRAIQRLAIAAMLVGVVSRGGEKAAGPKPTDEVSEAKPQTTCPVMGGKINKKLYADVNGKRIYVCCGGCIAPIKKDPAKYVEKLESQGVTLETVPTAGKHGAGSKSKGGGDSGHDHKGHGHK